MPIINRVPIHEIIAQLRRYNGTTDAREFLERFKYDMRTFKLSHEWALRNLDRILEGNASAWWSSKWHAVSIDLGNCQNDADFAALFNQTEIDFYRMFDHSAQESTFRQRNKAIRFSLGEDPTTYVTKKLEILRHLDANMTEAKKIAQIIKGLPYELRQTMVLQTINTVHELLEKLRNLSEVYEDQRGRQKDVRREKQTNSSYLVNPAFVNSSSYVQNPMYASYPFALQTQQAELKQIAKPKNSQQVGQVYPKGKYMKTPDGQAICNYCHYAGHIVRNCVELLERKKRSLGNNYQSRDNRRYNSQLNNTNNEKPQNLRSMQIDDQQSMQVFHTESHKAANNESYAHSSENGQAQ